MKPKILRTWSPSAFTALLERNPSVPASVISYRLQEAGLSYTPHAIRHWKVEGCPGPPHPLVIDILVDLFVEAGETRSKVRKSLQPERRKK